MAKSWRLAVQQLRDAAPRMLAVGHHLQQHPSATHLISQVVTQPCLPYPQGEC